MRRRLAAGLAVGALALAGVLAPVPASAQNRDQMTIGLSQFPSNFNPNVDSMLAKSWILYTSQRPITAFDADWKLNCVLCEELPSIAKGTAQEFTNAAGQRTVRATYTLKPNLKWGDGTPVTTKDVVFTWTIGKDQRTGFANNDFYTKKLVNVTAQDDRRFTVERDKFSCDYNNMEQFVLLPAHVEEPIYRADPENYKTKTAYDTQTTNPALYNGPFRIAAVERGASVTLEPNPMWEGPRSPFRRVVIRAIENLPALEANLLSGDVDYVSGELGFTIDQLLALQKRQPDRFTYTYRPGLVYEHIDLNLDNPLLKDVRVRQALLYAIDREVVTKELFEGKQPVAHTSVNPIDANFDPNVPKYGFDPAKARQLLDAAGFRPGPGGIRVDGQGRRLSFEFQTTAGNTSRETVQQVLQAQWKEIGVEVVIKNEPARVFFGQTMRERKFTGLAMFAWISSPDSPPRTILHSSQVPTAENGWGGQNYMNYQSARMDKALDDLDVTCDAGPRRAAWAEFQKIYAEEVPVLPLFFRVEPYAIPKTLSGLQPRGHQFSSTMGVEDWRMTGAR
ncbi:MAG: peptide ABC transporter substrate-binding protein [Rhodospirillales bacterium]|jgi:peptide/nickel transport system substrate-binding protein